MSSPLISVLLPTVRPERFRCSFDTVKLAAEHVPYEIIVVSDFEQGALGCNDPLAHLQCRWIRRQRLGPVDAIETALGASHAPFVFVLNDESILGVGALDILYNEAIKDPRRVYGPTHLPLYDFKYYGLPFVPFPFVHRDLLTVLGGLFDTAYRAFYADPDLGMRAHATSVPLVTIGGAVIHHHNGDDEVKRQNWKQYFATDQATFKERWGHLGEFSDC